MVKCGIGINAVRAWLGHVGIDTAGICAEINLETKMKAMEPCEAEEPDDDRPWKDGASMPAWLKTL